MAGWYGPSPDDCGCECSASECTCEDSRSSFISGGLSTISLSGGLNYGTVSEVDSPYASCTGGSVPSPAPSDLGLDLSASSSTLFSVLSCNTETKNTVCAPSDAIKGWYTDKTCDGMGGFAWRGFNLEPRFGCASGNYVADLSAKVTFFCDELGQYDYTLAISGSFIYAVQAVGGASLPGGWSLPTSGTDWTRSVAGSTTSYERNSGSARIEYTLIANFPASLFVYLVAFSTTVDSSASTVSLWTPNPRIDYTQISENGTATLT